LRDFIMGFCQDYQRGLSMATAVVEAIGEAFSRIAEETLAREEGLECGL
jgi:hypothetical protein